MTLSNKSLRLLTEKYQCTVNDELTSGVVDDSDTDPELMAGEKIITDTEHC